MMDGVCGELCVIGQVEFLEHTGPVHADGFGAEHQLLGNFRQFVPRRHFLQGLQFPL